jgi:hypothetical protein
MNTGPDLPESARRQQYPHNDRSWIAYLTLLLSGIGIAILGGISIRNDAKNSMTIFNTVLPVFSSWVGTILAFYFGRENFDIASTQVSEANRRLQEVVGTLSPEQRGSQPVASVMRRIEQIAFYQIPPDKSLDTITIEKIYDKFQGSVSRMPILDSKNIARYLIHKSRFDAYRGSGGKLDVDIASFLRYHLESSIGFGINEGFVVVSERTPLNTAKKLMEETSSCQDIIVTKNGGPDEPMSGWLSNTRLSRYILSN